MWTLYPLRTHSVINYEYIARFKGVYAPWSAVLCFISRSPAWLIWQESILAPSWVQPVPARGAAMRTAALAAMAGRSSDSPPVRAPPHCCVLRGGGRGVRLRVRRRTPTGNFQDFKTANKSPQIPGNKTKDEQTGEAVQSLKRCKIALSLIFRTIWRN